MRALMPRHKLINECARKDLNMQRGDYAPVPLPRCLRGRQKLQDAVAKRGLAVRRLRGLRQRAVLPILRMQKNRVTTSCMEDCKQTLVVALSYNDCSQIMPFWCFRPKRPEESTCIMLALAEA